MLQVENNIYFHGMLQVENNIYFYGMLQVENKALKKYGLQNSIIKYTHYLISCS